MDESEWTLPCAHAHARAREILEEFRLLFQSSTQATAAQANAGSRGAPFGVEVDQRKSSGA